MDRRSEDKDLRHVLCDGFETNCQRHAESNVQHTCGLPWIDTSTIPGPYSWNQDDKQAIDVPGIDTCHCLDRRLSKDAGFGSV